MPLTRYQVRSEYGLADPELYRIADKDDPEALLEGVAMAGLVGVLRQLGDLAEFAAEIFHDLHEEVMTTAARGHGLMARVQQLEAEFPSIEKAFLSQTNHSSFFSSSAGGDWRPNLRMEQNLITRGDLPRFVMDSYEECRGPPRLFLLDKFDVAGAGACLKRYTDPSFFKVEAAAAGMSTVEIQREKRIRKVKKKGSRWRNGETPEVTPTSHSKLHELFLEERVENGHPDPARVVKLKRRLLHASAFDLKPGKSYMEKFLDPASPEHKIVREVSPNQSPLRLTMGKDNDSGIEIPEVKVVSPVKKSLQDKDSTCLSPSEQEVILKPFPAELNGEARGIVHIPDPLGNGEMDESLSTVHKLSIEEEFEHGNREESLDGDHSDDFTSEVDNYMDALTTMDSEIETDNEYKSKDDRGFMNVRKHGADPGEIDEQLDLQANFSDSQSFGNSSMSDGGNSSFKKGGSSFSYCDSVSNSVDNSPSDGEGNGKFNSTKDHVTEAVDIPSQLPELRLETSGTESSELLTLNGSSTEEKKILDTREASCSSCIEDLNPMLLSSDSAADSHEVSARELDETSSAVIQIHSTSPSPDINETNVAGPSAVSSDALSQINHDTLFTSSSESGPVNDIEHEDPSGFPILHMSDMSQIVPEKEGSDNSVDELLQTEYPDENCRKSSVEECFAPECSPVTLTMEQAPSFPLVEVEEESGVTLPSSGLDVLGPDGLVSEGDDAAAAIDSQNLTSMEEASEITTTEEKMKPEISEPADGTEMTGHTSTADLVRGDAVSFGHPSNCSDSQGPEDHVNSDDVANEVAQAGDAALSPIVAGPSDDEVVDNVVCPSSDIICSPSRTLTSIQESSSVSEVVESPETLSESVKQMEMKLVEDSPAGSVSSPYKDISEGHSETESIEPSGDPPLVEQTKNTEDVTAELSSDLSNQDLEIEPTYQSTSVEAVDDTVSVASLPNEAISSEQLQAGDFRLESVHANETTSKSLNLQTLPAFHLEEPGVPLEQSSELQSEEHDEECGQEDEDQSEPFNLQSEQIQHQTHTVELCLDTLTTKCVEDVPGEEHLVQSTTQEHNATELVMNPFGSIFPSFGLLPEESNANLEEMPPLPPLPPMQWRIGKVQPAPLVPQSESIDQCQDPFSAIKPCTNDEAQSNFTSSDGKIVQTSNPFLSPAVTDSLSLQHSSAELLENSLQPSLQSSGMVTANADVNDYDDCTPLEGAQSLNASSTLPDAHNEELAHGFSALEPSQTNSNPSPVIAATECKTAECNPEPSEGTPIEPSNQLAPDTGLDAKGQQDAVNIEREQEEHHDKPVLLVPAAEEQQPQHDLSASQGETIWLPSTFGLPPTYEGGKLNGNKLPRPRNPLMDAVAAHDKSKLRKVAERARPQIGPKIEERDSLLEQIRTKSFNLKPAAATRPNIQGIQGPKTNLKVAAILEKANAIRQALAGSDEDDDSDNWSDS